ncbi:MAG TPA: hypothetical protein PK014_03140 [Thermoanaerobaculia bacterium]|nr:hypothetical protein [Thermoanaerobaculia bacterium]HUM29053.1 hypothetical protein [Thermoanaerobaculia bacterium]HXK67391.1 hypothetical protein [Thermoanaerobaculia bacterium]
MITGFNTDVDFDSKVYHVQTEDKGIENPYIESLVYMGGAIIFSKRIEYKEKLVKGITEKEIRALMENQHRTLIAAIKRGRLAPKKDLPPTKLTVPVEEEEVITIEKTTQTIPSDLLNGEAPEAKTLDEVILEYLSTAQEKDQLEIVIPDNLEFYAGQKVDQVIKISTSLSGQSIPNVPVEVRVMTTFLAKPLEVFSGITAEDGKIRLVFSIPAFTQGAAAVVILARSREYGNAEFKKLVMKKT